MMTLLQKIVAAGTRADTAFEETVRLKAMNRGILTGIGILISVILLGIDSQPFVLHALAMILVLLISIGFNAVGFTKLAHYFSAFCIVSWLMVTSVSFGDTLGLEFYYLVILVSLLIVLEFPNWIRLFCAGLVACIIIVVKYIHLHYPAVFPAPRLSPFFYVCSVVCSFALVSIMCLNLLNDFKRNKAALVSSKHELELSNQFKDKLFSIIGHDLKSPLNSLVSALQFLNDESLPAEDRRFLLKELEERTNKTMGVLSELVEWSSSSYFQSKRVVATTKEPVVVYNMIEGIFSFFAHTATQKRVSLINKVSPDFSISADAGQMQFVFRNLIGNAIKFSKTDGAAQVLLQSETTDTRRILKVIDNGIGMTEELRSKLFNIDTRVSTEGTMNEKGTGLGLIFCKEFIENNGGTLTVASSTKTGTVFTIMF